MKMLTGYGSVMSRAVTKQQITVFAPNEDFNSLGPVVQSIVSLTSSLRCHFVKYMPTT